MADNSLPDSVVEQNPRLKNAVIIGDLSTGARLVSVSSFTLTWPLTGELSGYGQVTEVIVVVPEGVDPIVGSERPIGGTEILADEISALPGATEFLKALNDRLLKDFIPAPEPEPTP